MSRNVSIDDDQITTFLVGRITREFIDAHKGTQLARQCPPCFEDEDDWLAWCCWSARSHQAHHTSWHKRYCGDCTPEYKNKMVARGRCKYPETEFFIEVRKTPKFGVDTSLIGVNILCTYKAALSPQSLSQSIKRAIKYGSLIPVDSLTEAAYVQRRILAEHGMRA